MIRLQWNGLRVGHHVLVHDERDHDMPLVPGTVELVQTAAGSNDLAIRISSADGSTTLVHPRRLAVHLTTLDPHEDCWLCTIDAAATAAA
jgi:hypothetical protein